MAVYLDTLRTRLELYPSSIVFQLSCGAGAAALSRVSSAGRHSGICRARSVPSTPNGAAFIRHSFRDRIGKARTVAFFALVIPWDVTSGLACPCAARMCCAQWADNHNNCERGKLQPCCRSALCSCVCACVRRGGSRSFLCARDRRKGKQGTRKEAERSREREKRQRKSRRSDGKTARNLATLILLCALPARAHFRPLALYGRDLFLFRPAAVVVGRGERLPPREPAGDAGSLARVVPVPPLAPTARCGGVFWGVLTHFILLGAVPLHALNSICVNFERRQDMRMRRFVPVLFLFRY